MWWKPEPGSMDEAEAAATWELIVELRTAVASIDVESLATKAAQVQPWVKQRWPTLLEEVDSIIGGLRADPDSPQHRVQMEILADELEDHLGTGLRWPARGDMPNN